MKGRYILACALASLVAFAPLSLVGANAFSNGHITDEEPYVSPMQGFVYTIYDSKNEYLVTKEFADVYDYAGNTDTQQIAEVLYTFDGEDGESFIIVADSDIYELPQLQAVNNLFSINSLSHSKPYFEHYNPFSITVEADIVIPFDSTADRSSPRTEHVEFIIDSTPFDSQGSPLYKISLDSVLTGIYQQNRNLVVNGECCLFESAIFTFSNKSVNLVYNSYQGLPYKTYNLYVQDTLSNYYTKLPPLDDGDIVDGFDAIMRVPVAFLSTELLPNFTFGSLILIILGFVVFGFAIKLCFGG